MEDGQEPAVVVHVLQQRPTLDALQAALCVQVLHERIPLHAMPLVAEGAGLSGGCQRRHA